LTATCRSIRPTTAGQSPRKAKTVATADITNKQLLHYNDFHYRYGVNGGIADALPGTCDPAVISPPRYSYTTKATGYAFPSIARNIIL